MSVGCFPALLKCKIIAVLRCTTKSDTELLKVYEKITDALVAVSDWHALCSCLAASMSEDTNI